MATITMTNLDRAFAAARSDLVDVGLLADGLYLDRIECVLSPLPSGWWRECGWVYDGGVDGIRGFIGFEPRVIYIPMNAAVVAYSPGGTLTDVIRHEFAHAWYWLDAKHVDGPWFRKAFGARYQDTTAVAPETYDSSNFVSEYATTSAKEDFAETFMTYLRFRRSLERFRNRAGLYAKLLAVEDAVQRAASERAARIRGPKA